MDRNGICDLLHGDALVVAMISARSSPDSAMAENRITASEMRQKCRESLHAIIR